MTETNIAQNAPILVAIDVAKARHEVLMASSSVSRLKPPAITIVL